MRFSHIAAGSTFTTAELHPQTAEDLDCSTQAYHLSSLRYDLSKLQAKGLVEKLPHSRRYRLLPEGYSLCLVFLKLFERIYAPLTAGCYNPFPQTVNSSTSAYPNSTSSTNGSSRPSTISSTRLASKPPKRMHNENKLPVTTRITACKVSSFRRQHYKCISVFNRLPSSSMQSCNQTLGSSLGS